MRRAFNSIYWALWFSAFTNIGPAEIKDPLKVSIQNDGSFLVSDSQGGISDFVKQGTPRQSIQLGAQSCNLSYGLNTAGKQTILLSVPPTATNPVVFELGDKQVTVPPKSVLRLTLSSGNQIEKMDGNPAETVLFTSLSSLPTPSETGMTAPPSQEQVQAKLEPEAMNVTDPAPLIPSPSSQSSEPLADAGGWPGKLLQPPLAESAQEEEQFYARTEFGPRFISPMNLVSVSGPGGNYGLLNQKKIAFSTGYRQDVDVGVWLTEWFGLALETGIALNAVRGNTQGMDVSSTTFWTVPLLAQLCFQYPNESGWIPYLNFGFGGGWTIFKVGGIDYTQPGGPSIPRSISGTGNSINNAYQIAAGVRYRLYEELSITMAYKFYGNSQATVNLDNGVQMTLGSPVTQSAEVGLNFSF